MKLVLILAATKFIKPRIGHFLMPNISDRILEHIPIQHLQHEPKLPQDITFLTEWFNDEVSLINPTECVRGAAMAMNEDQLSMTSHKGRKEGRGAILLLFLDRQTCQVASPSSQGCQIGQLNRIPACR